MRGISVVDSRSIVVAYSTLKDDIYGYIMSINLYT